MIIDSSILLEFFSPPIDPGYELISNRSLKNRIKRPTNAPYRSTTETLLPLSRSGRTSVTAVIPSIPRTSSSRTTRKSTHEPVSSPGCHIFTFCRKRLFPKDRHQVHMHSIVRIHKYTGCFSRLLAPVDSIRQGSHCCGSEVVAYRGCPMDMSRAIVRQ
jgi:hypothetical protein